MKDLAAQLVLRKQQHLYRSRTILDSPQGVEVTVEGRRYLSFCSNDYLGLANHPEVVAAFHKGLDEWGAGSGAAHLVSGHSRVHHELEQQLADFTQRPRALLFSTGYMANLGVATALAGRGDTVLEDRLNHASLLDGGLLCGARFSRFPHRDADALERRLETSGRGGRLVLTDGVFSMDGDLAPLPRYASACRRHRATLVVDDAHGLGVLGARGGGTVEHFGLDTRDVPVLVGTLGKAFGSFGAFVAGDRDLIDLLVQRARTYIYTTALPPAVAAATRTALAIVQSEPWRRERALAHAARFRQLAMQANLPLGESFTPIQPVLLGQPEAATAASATLLERGFLVAAIRPPTVPAGSSRLRVTLSAAHEEKDVERLVEALADVLHSRQAQPGRAPDSPRAP